MSNYNVFAYTIERLKELLSCCHDSSAQIVERKRHIEYFNAYFIELSARTIVVEYDYVDGDFLDDYSSYYVKCFHEYDRHCVRLHFFSDIISKKSLDRTIKSGLKSSLCKLNNSYLGFIVVKPLPKTVIGRTCLKTYSDDNGRLYLSTRSYDVNLFGIPLHVTSLAYQEQDRVAAACATSALWSIFHKTGKLFHHPILSPIEITKIATSNSFFRSRFIPSEGLTLEQMAQAIREIGLESFPINASDEYVLQSTIYAYMKYGIPIALAVSLVDASSVPHKLFPNGGGHAVAVTGFRIDNSRPATPVGGTGFLSRASKITKLYVHDDQIGPFARIEFDGAKVNLLIGTDTKTFNSLSTNWTNLSGVVGGVRAVPDTLLIPIYHKIRIPFELVQRVIIDFDAIIEAYRSNRMLSLANRLEWDIHLSSVNLMKSEILKNNICNKREKLAFLTESMPKYIWRAAAYMADDLIFELIFDATDIEQGDYFVDTLYINSAICTQIKTILATAMSAAPFAAFLERPDKHSLKLLIENF